MPTESPLFTVYTPTYNRAHTLHRCYESLKAQTLKDFEWLIVDDGSTDDTANMVKGWQAESQMTIRYVPLPHRGAHYAHNASLQEAHGSLWLKLDSDDGCLPLALERLRFHWESIPEVERPSFSGVTGLCEDHEGNLVGTLFPQSPLDCTSAELEYVYKVRGEKWGFLRADVLRLFPYPEGVPGNFIPESYIWCQVAKRFRTRHVNERLRVYWTDAPSLVHGRPNPATNAEGHRLMFRGVLNLEAEWVVKAPLRLLRAAVQYARFSWHCRSSLARQWQELDNLKAKLLWLTGAPLALGLYLRDCKRVRG